jgi:hypothetical protein
VGSSACADDEYLISDSQTKLQVLLDIAEFYGSMYKVTYGAGKTKVTVVGSVGDMQHYSNVTPWKLNGQTVKVTTDNDHLGQIVSGVAQEQNNVDSRIDKGRKNLFGMLGAAFSFKCLLSPVVKIHLYRTYTCPILRSGLSSFSLRTTMLEPLSIFHRKTLRGVLNLSKSSNIPALNFLLVRCLLKEKYNRISSLYF